jgi:preprotein translocase subunit SecG
MLIIISNVFYVLIAVAMIVLILLQRGAGADAGSGFGGGASGTVFGSRGSANFLSRSTAVLAGLFMLISLAMGIWLSRPATTTSTGDDLGVMGSLVEPAPGATAPATSSDVPPPAAPAPTTSSAPDASVPAAVPAEPAAEGEATPAVPQAGSGPAGDQNEDAGQD